MQRPLHLQQLLGVAALQVLGLVAHEEEPVAAAVRRHAQLEHRAGNGAGEIDQLLRQAPRLGAGRELHGEPVFALHAVLEHFQGLGHGAHLVAPVGACDGVAVVPVGEPLHVPRELRDGARDLGDGHPRGQCDHQRQAAGHRQRGVEDRAAREVSQLHRRRPEAVGGFVALPVHGLLQRAQRGLEFAVDDLQRPVATPAGGGVHDAGGQREGMGRLLADRPQRGRIPGHEPLGGIDLRLELRLQPLQRGEGRAHGVLVLFGEHRIDEAARLAEQQGRVAHVQDALCLAVDEGLVVVGDVPHRPGGVEGGRDGHRAHQCHEEHDLGGERQMRQRAGADHAAAPGKVAKGWRAGRGGVAGRAAQRWGVIAWRSAATAAGVSILRCRWRVTTS